MDMVSPIFNHVIDATSLEPFFVMTYPGLLFSCEPVSPIMYLFLGLFTRPVSFSVASRRLKYEFINEKTSAFQVWVLF